MRSNSLQKDIDEVRQLLALVKKGLERNDATHKHIVRDIENIKRDNESSFNDVRARILAHWRLSLVASAIGLLVSIYYLFIE